MWKGSLVNKFCLRFTELTSNVQILFIKISQFISSFSMIRKFSKVFSPVESTKASQGKTLRLLIKAETVSHKSSVIICMSKFIRSVSFAVKLHLNSFRLNAHKTTLKQYLICIHSLKIPSLRRLQKTELWAARCLQKRIKMNHTWNHMTFEYQRIFFHEDSRSRHSISVLRKIGNAFHTFWFECATTKLALMLQKLLIISTVTTYVASKQNSKPRYQRTFSKKSSAGIFKELSMKNVTRNFN